MNLRRRVAPIAFAALCCGIGPASAMTPAEVYAKVSPSVWRVSTYDADGVPLAFGSGVVIGPEAVVTNCHVLAKAHRVAVRRDKISLDAHLELWDPQRDVCQIRVPTLAAPVVALGRASELQVGQNLFAIGNPKGLDLTMSAGLLSSIRRNDREQIVLLQTTAAISGGSSGGGLFDERGLLVGLTTLGSVSGDAQNLNFAIPVDWVRELPERHARLAHPKAADMAAIGASAAAPAPAPAPAPSSSSSSSSPRSDVVAGTGSAALDDLSRLPYASDGMRQRYKLWLTRPMPRAFAISEGGRWYQSWGTNSAAAGGSARERALTGCAKLNEGRCFVYAEDDRVVYVKAGGS